MQYLLLAIAGSAAMSLVLKLFRAQRGNRFGIILGNYLTCVALGALITPEKRMLFSGSGVTLACGAVGGALYVAGLMCMQTSTRLNGAMLTAAFAKLGLLVSLAMSILWFGETPSLMQGIGIALVVAALALINSRDRAEVPDQNRQQAPAFGLLLLTLLVCGAGDAMSKVFERLGPPQEDTLFFFYLFLTAALLSALLGWLEWRKTGRRMLPGELAAGIAVGIPNYFSSLLLLKALTRLPAVLVYPVFSTGTILLVMALSALLFHERPGKRQLLGMGLVLAALAMLNL